MPIFIVRARGDWQACWPADTSIRIALTRQTPGIVADSDDLTDLFCLGDDDAAGSLQERGWTIVRLTDGWYQDDTGGGVAIWGQGRFWEIRNTPFSVKETIGPASAATAEGTDGEALDVRRGILGA